MQDFSAIINELFRSESRRVLATLIRALGDFNLAEDAMQEAFAAASADWESNGIPDDPVAWLISAGRFRAIDLIRREAQFRELLPGIVSRVEEITSRNMVVAGREIEDDQLRLIFTCCHPAIDPRIQVPLTLREVCGLSTEEIADAFLTAPATMAQRIVRGKAKIRSAGIPYVIPSRDELPDRIDAVLSVIYLVYNEGYSASMGSQLLRVELSSEAIRLGRLLVKLLPDPEVMGLLALMLLHESRRDARVDKTGDIVLLEQQDRSTWNYQFIEEGQRLVQQSLASRRIGAYTLQAAISAVHADATVASETDWHQIVALYDVLFQIDTSPVVELNRAVAVAMRDTPTAGLQLINGILDRGELTDYYLTHSARGELLRRSGDLVGAKVAFERAFELAKQDSERRFLAKRLKSLVNHREERDKN
ncbi:RNA polymerase sigma factor [Adhaeretor mobilis]|uniref:RNA polymerase sigma factor n=1 Tax=Adhaeretor mobilis TaxID=1930276 RepID=A0A517N0W1_9BACT|nr:RNA polymerase sigma factor [Adhaeretor mobilis]QDT00782.1 RNA polymerase sigma factor [Adhaeretor mobilis]